MSEPESPQGERGATRAGRSKPARTGLSEERTLTARGTLATAGRVLGQLRHDPRTIALLVAVPSLLLILFRYVFDGSPAVFDRVGLPMLGIFPFTTMFLVTSVAMVRERTSGTLERLLTTPLPKLDLLAGYGLAFGAAALVQGLVAAAVAVGGLGLDVAAGIGPVLLLAVLTALLGMSLGLFFSAFAANEFQAVQFLPAAVIPQVLLGGLLAPRDEMATVLRWISDVLPMSYAIDAMTAARTESALDAGTVLDLAVVAGCTVAALALGAATLRRRTA